MGAAEVYTKISLKGKKEELDAMLELIKEYSTTMKDKYKNGEQVAYFDIISIKNLSIDEVYIELDGPYGRYDVLRNVHLFRELLQKAPKAYFKGYSSGFITGADVYYGAEYKNGILYIEDEENDFTEHFKYYTKESNHKLTGFSISKKTVLSYDGCAEEIIIPKNIKYIDDYAFSRCTSIKKVVLPDGVTYIGEGAFRGCTNLTSINIPDSVTSIWDVAFKDCPLSQETIKRIKSINSYAI